MSPELAHALEVLIYADRSAWDCLFEWSKDSGNEALRIQHEEAEERRKAAAIECARHYRALKGAA